MPGIDGIELARRATVLRPTLRVMFITGFAAVALKAKEMAPRESKVLSKPFHLRDLVSEVDRMLARSEEHTSELQSLMRTSYAVFCLKKKKQNKHQETAN